MSIYLPHRRGLISVKPDLRRGLISYWKLEEASGTRVDSYGTNDLTDNNTVTQAEGKLGQAAQFTRANSEYLSIADNASLSTGDIDFTMAVWVSPDSLGTGFDRNILSKVLTWATDIEFRLAQYRDDTWQFIVGDASGNNSGNAGGDAVVVSSWALLVAWHDSVNNVVGLQVNNAAPRTVSYSLGGHDSTAAFQLGFGEGADQYYDGRIDAVGFWKRMLTAEERSLLYNHGRGWEYPWV